MRPVALVVGGLRVDAGQAFHPAAARSTEGDNHMHRRTHRARLIAVASLALILPALSSAPANASLLGLAGDQCADAPVSQPFTAWNDNADYELAPGGNFESSAQGWTLSNGAAVVTGNESFN